MQGDFEALKRIKKKFLKLKERERDRSEELDDVPEDGYREIYRKRLKQKIILLREKLGEEIFEESEVAKFKLKQKISKLTEKLLRAEKNEEEFFEDAEDDEDNKSIPVKLIQRISKFGERLLKEEEGKSRRSSGVLSTSDDASESEENDGCETMSQKSGVEDSENVVKILSDDGESGSDAEEKMKTSKKIKQRLKRLFDAESLDFDSDERGSGTGTGVPKIVFKRPKLKVPYTSESKDESVDDPKDSEEERKGTLDKLKKLLTKNEEGWCESSDTDRTENESVRRAASQNVSEGTELNHLEVKILEKLGQRLKERTDKVQRYFQRSGKIGEVNRRLKSQIWSSVVTIVLVEGKNLLPMDLDGLSDPYVKFRLGHEKYKSKVILKNLNPSWLEQFDLHLYDDQSQELEVTVWDKDKSKDDFMGRCSIHLSSLEREKTHSIWQDLEEGAGSIHLLLTISGTTASETISDLTTYEDNTRERKNIENRYALRNSLHNLRDVGHLTVKVYRATGLAAADLGGKSDPFCVLELVNARLQTQTEYKTLSPSWQKIFTFNVKDINSVLEVTVYDEDRDHKVEFLGKVAIPLLRIRNGEKKWYCLKDKKLHARAKGNCPMILLEMYVIWNPIRAWIRTLNPKEEKYMQGEVKFKRQIFVRNVLRLKAIIMIIIGWGKLIQNLRDYLGKLFCLIIDVKFPRQSNIKLKTFSSGLLHGVIFTEVERTDENGFVWTLPFCYEQMPQKDCFEWERPAQSAVALISFIALCYYFEPYMIPVALLLIFLKYYIVLWLTGGKSLSEEDDDVLGDDEDDDEDKDKEEKKSLKERLQAIQEVTQTVQNAIGYIASLGEQIKNTFNFTVPFVSYLAIALSLAAMLIMYIIPVRYLIMMAGVNKFARKLLRPQTIPNNEILDLLSRVPDDEELIAYRELRPYSSSDLERRREQRKKHKSS